MPPKRRRQRGKRGEGTVYHRGEGRSKPWRAVVLGASKDFATQSEAENWRRAQLTVASTPPDRVLVVEALRTLIEDRDWVAPTTTNLYLNYATHAAKHIGLIPVGDVTPDDIARMDRALREELVGATAAYILGLCATLFRRLMALRVITYDPVAAYKAITPPRARQGRPLRTRRAVDVGVIRLVLRELEDTPYHAPVAWMVVLGLRAGEARGLRWANVRGGVAWIIEQRRANERHTPAPLKTERQIGDGRAVPVPAALLALTPTGDDLVFPHPDGGSLSAKTLSEHLRRACLRVGVPHITPHQLRHTCATGLEALGCTRERRDALLGHAGKETGDEYTHIGVDTLRPWVERWAGVVLGAGADGVRLGA